MSPETPERSRRNEASLIPGTLIRDVEADDLGFIFQSWSKSAYCGPARLVPWAIYEAGQRRHMVGCLERAKAAVMVHPDDPSIILGFAVYEVLGGERSAPSLVLHWLFLKSVWRGLGLASAFLTRLHPTWRAAPVILTQYSDRLPALRRRMRLVFDPYTFSEVQP